VDNEQRPRHDRAARAPPRRLASGPLAFLATSLFVTFS
jgi:hypothetical protein